MDDDNDDVDDDDDDEGGLVQGTEKYVYLILIAISMSMFHINVPPIIPKHVLTNAGISSLKRMIP